MSYFITAPDITETENPYSRFPYEELVQGDKNKETVTVSLSASALWFTTNRREESRVALVDVVVRTQKGNSCSCQETCPLHMSAS